MKLKRPVEGALKAWAAVLLRTKSKGRAFPKEII